MAQLAGVDAYGLISMIVEAAKTVKRNRETCQLLARRARMIGDLLQQLEGTQLMHHMETRNPVEQLEETLRHAYVLITSCRDSSYLHSFCMGGSRLIGFARCRMRSPSTSNFSPLSALSTTPVLGSSFWAELVLCAQGYVFCHVKFVRHCCVSERLVFFLKKKIPDFYSQWHAEICF